MANQTAEKVVWGLEATVCKGLFLHPPDLLLQGETFNKPWFEELDSYYFSTLQRIIKTR
jgi:hypothetical protein